MNKRLTSWIGVLLAGALLLTLPAQTLAQTSNPHPKEEVIYARLDADGSVEQAHVVNRILLPEGVSIHDFGLYSQVTNLTDTRALRPDGGQIQIPAGPAGVFYYQGDMQTSSLPWILSITYRLDGQTTAPGDLAGASGDLEMILTIRDNPDVPTFFFRSYSLQISITLDSERTRDIRTTGATMAAAGKNKIVTYVKMPGQNARYSLSMSVEDFEMDGIQLTGLPFSLDSDLSSLGAMIDGLDALQAGLEQIDTGTGDLLTGSGDLVQGISQIQQGLRETQQGFDTLNLGMDSWIAEGGNLLAGGAQIQSSLAEWSAGVSGMNLDTLTGQQALLSGGSTGMLNGITRLSGGLTQLQSLFTRADQNTTDRVGETYTDVQQANRDTLLLLTQQINDLTAADPVGNADEIEEKTRLFNLLTVNQELISGLDSGLNGSEASVTPGLVELAGSLTGQYSLLNDEIQALAALLAATETQMTTLRDAATGLPTVFGTYLDGVEAFVGGADNLQTGVIGLRNSQAELATGMDSLNTGATSLEDGLRELQTAVQAMQTGIGTMADDVSAMLDQLLPGMNRDDQEPMSFVSPSNTDVTLVQFVLSTQRIQSETQESMPAPEPAPSSFWQRLLALFGWD